MRGRDAGRQNQQAFNLDKAKSLLNEAGVSNVQFDLTFLTIPAEIGSLAQILAGDLDKIGVQLNLQPLETPAYLARMNNDDFGSPCRTICSRTRSPEPCSSSMVCTASAIRGWRTSRAMTTGG